MHPETTTESAPTTLQPWAVEDFTMVNCRDGALFRFDVVAQWIEKAAQHVLALVGECPRVRLYAYEHASTPWMAMDVFSQDSDASVTFTICLDGSTIDLSAPDDQFELCMPGVLDAMAFITSMCSLLNHGPVSSSQIWLTSLPPDAAPK